MSAVDEAAIRSEVRSFLKDADLTTTSERHVRLKVQEKMGMEVPRSIIERPRSISDRPLTMAPVTRASAKLSSPVRPVIRRRSSRSRAASDAMSQDEVQKFLSEKTSGELPKQTEKRKRSEAADDQQPPKSKARATTVASGFELGPKRRINVKEFKGRLQVDIREFYEKAGEERPGPKGLALTVEQWESVLAHMAEIEKAVEDRDCSYALELASNRRLHVKEYKGQLQIDLREYYEKEGETLPTKKGIALTPEEWSRLKTHASDVSAEATKMQKEAGPSKASTKAEPSAKSRDSNDTVPVADKAGGGGGSEDETMVELSDNRRASVSEYKGARLLNLREYYEKEGKMLPGKKGISLQAAQAKKMRDHVEKLTSALDTHELVKFDLGNRRYAQVKEYKGNFSVDVREFYEKEGKELPGFKGLSIKPDQWKTLCENLDGLIAKL